ncbi:hypothetical protein CO613_10250 [Lysobacteraceae bacterium NML07-0707]|nr:hypothetical protein CO613_10250 [Xanthomonadaceae bacterium NML07-0707]
MSNVENLVPRMLSLIREDLKKMTDSLDTLTHRVGRLETAIAAGRRDVVMAEEANAEQSVRIDKIESRIAKIERRLEIDN